MNDQHTVTDSHLTTASTRLHGWGLYAARAVWALLASFVIAVSLLTLPLTYAERLSQAILPPLRFAEFGLPELGLSPEFYATVFPTLGLIHFLIAASIGLLIFLRRSDEPIALVVSFMLVCASGINASAYNAWIRSDPGIKPLLVLVNALSYIAILSTVLLFPDGRFYPRWMRWFMLLVIPLAVLDGVIGLGRPLGSSAAGSPAVIGLGLIAIFGLIQQRRRYRHALTPTQRQQVKWILFGMALSLLPVTLFNIVDPFITPWLIENPPIRILYRFGVQAFIFFLPNTAYAVAIAFAIFRYRLWDIDYAINRSLGYAIVTGGLVLLFLILFLVLQSVILNPIALTALAIGSGLIFNPVRLRVQRFIDRRVYRLRFPIDAVADYARSDRAAPPPKKPITLPGSLTGTTLGEYSITDWVGRGGMGEVYKGQIGGRTVAIKLLPGMADPETRVRFEREGQILQRLDHPNIVRVYEFGESGGLRYMVMDYLDGVPLNQYMSGGGPMSLATIRKILADVTSALDYIHSRGIVHRDLKPANIMLKMNPDRTIAGAVLMDFGVAKSETTSITGAETMGTIDYMAPEQIQAAGAVDQRADVYALGIMLYEMATGTRPFQGNAGQVLFAHLRQPAPDPRVVVPDLPGAVVSAIQRAMAKNPAERPSTAGEIARAIA
ncbi:MAG: serine/threonine protein kinase [Chloroflexi bacterium]|nr:serine/threonine protein kinase [Chloroflexota bacterium]